MIAVDVWRGVPFVMLLMLAGLQTIPAEQYEAAAIDGAGAWPRFRYVTWPNLRYLVVVATTLDVINTIRHYDIIGVMTGGGPAGATEVLPVLIYNTAFRGNRLGEAAADRRRAARDRAGSGDRLRAHREARRGPERAMTHSRTARSALLWAIALAAAAVMIFPFYWMLNTSLKPTPEVFASPPTFVSAQLVARRLPRRSSPRARSAATSSTA